MEGYEGTLSKGRPMALDTLSLRSFSMRCLTVSSSSSCIISLIRDCEPQSPLTVFPPDPEDIRWDGKVRKDFAVLNSGYQPEFAASRLNSCFSSGCYNIEGTSIENLLKFGR